MIATLSRKMRWLRWGQVPKYPYEKWNYEHQAVFVHIPKCAGTSVVELFDSGSPRRTHAEWLRFYQADRKAFERFFKFTFVRNPIDRFLSAYRYIIAGGAQRPRDRKIQKYVLSLADDFEKFATLVSHEVLYQIHHFRPQVTFVCDETGDLMVDYVGHVESMQESVAQIFHHLGRAIPEVPHSNRTNELTALSASTAHWESVPERIHRFYRRDSELFGYAQRATSDVTMNHAQNSK